MDNPILTVLMMIFGNPFGIALIVFLIVVLFKKLFGKKEEPQQPQQEEAPVSTPDCSGTAIIFINGGAPANGDKMGTLTVDGRSLDILYSEAPLAVTISAGVRNVVIEGGLAGDARIDRAITFRSYDVLTVDMPGVGDADLIRHQMIRYTEYSNALRESGFRPTKKEL